LASDGFGEFVGDLSCAPYAQFSYLLKNSEQDFHFDFGGKFDAIDEDLHSSSTCRVGNRRPKRPIQ
jgi:hypothetical protein